MNEIAVPYERAGRQFEGSIIWNGGSTKRPVLFMQPDWYGVSPEMRAIARELASDRYIVLLADMFGAGTGEHASSKPFDELLQRVISVRKDLKFTVECGSLALKTMLAEAQARDLVDPDAPTFAVGYCAGAGFLMEQARAGEDLDALVALHITNPNPLVPETPCNIKGRVLTIHGSADPVTPKAMIDALEAELTAAGVEWQTVMFGGAGHAFCVPSAEPDGQRAADLHGIHYDEKLCRASYRMMHEFFEDTVPDRSANALNTDR